MEYNVYFTIEIVMIGNNFQTLPENNAKMVQNGWKWPNPMAKIWYFSVFMLNQWPARWERCANRWPVKNTTR